MYVVQSVLRNQSIFLVEKQNCDIGMLLGKNIFAYGIPEIEF